MVHWIYAQYLLRCALHWILSRLRVANTTLNAPLLCFVVLWHCLRLRVSPSTQICGFAGWC